MHDPGASPFSVSLLASAASTPFFLFTLPAGAIADIVNRRTLIVSAVLWQGACSALLALGAWTSAINIKSVVACIFALGIGLAFGGPVWGAMVPDIVSTEEIPSAVTLGGVQVNLSGIVGPALGGLLLPLLGAPLLISINALTFVIVVLVVLQWKPRPMHSSRLRENFAESFINSLRYALDSPSMHTILFRNLLFSLVISVVPALLPVIALKELHLSRGPTRACFYMRGRRLLGRSDHSATVPQAADVPKCNHLDCDDNSDCHAVCDGVLAPSACADGMRSACRCGLGACGIRDLVGWTARDARMGAGTNECVPNYVGQGGIALGALLLGTGVAHAGLGLTLAAAATLALVMFAVPAECSHRIVFSEFVG